MKFFTLKYSIISPVCRVGLSVAKQIYVLQKNGAYRRRHHFDSRQHNYTLS